MENVTVFDWNNFHSEKNAKLIEDLLDRKTAPFTEIIKIFGLKNDAIKDADGYLRLILEFPSEFINGDEVVIDKILPVLIKTGDLPTEICRLPRYKRQDINFGIEIISDYYEKQCKYSVTLTHVAPELIDEIVKNEANYSPDIPITLTYSEAVKWLSDSRLPKSIIAKYAKERRIGVYLEVTDEHVYTTSVMHFCRQSITYFRLFNCGNPYYKLRHPGLERLQQTEIEILFGNQPIRIRTEIRNYIGLQTTDLETKFHLQREIHYKAKNIFSLEDGVVFLKEDIEYIVRQEAGSAKNSKPHDTAELNVSAVQVFQQMIVNYQEREGGSDDKETPGSAAFSGSTKAEDALIDLKQKEIEPENMEKLTFPEAGKKGNIKRNEPHEKAKQMAQEYLRNHLLKEEKYNDLMSNDLITKIRFYLDEKGMKYKVKKKRKLQSYSYRTVWNWVKELIPKKRIQKGAPKKL